MKNPKPTLLAENISELRAKQAIQRIQKWMEQRYPVMCALSQSKLIIECLIEVTEERKFIAQQ